MNKLICSFIAVFLLTACSGYSDIQNDCVSENLAAGLAYSAASREKSEKITENTKIINCDLLSGDEEIDNLIKENIVLSDSEQVESAEWDENNIIFRVSIQQAQGENSEYSHKKDYFFVKDDPVGWFMVDYPDSKDIYADRHVESACDFGYQYVDVTFDGHKDIVIFLGYQGSHGAIKNCAYIYKEGKYEYVRSFEDIPNYSIDENEKVICGSYNSSNSEYVEMKYEYKEGIFEKIWESRELFDE